MHSEPHFGSRWWLIESLALLGAALAVAAALHGISTAGAVPTRVAAAASATYLYWFVPGSVVAVVFLVGARRVSTRISPGAARLANTLFVGAVVVGLLAIYQLHPVLMLAAALPSVAAGLGIRVPGDQPLPPTVVGVCLGFALGTMQIVAPVASVLAVAASLTFFRAGNGRAAGLVLLLAHGPWVLFMVSPFA